MGVQCVKPAWFSPSRTGGKRSSREKARSDSGLVLLLSGIMDSHIEFRLLPEQEINHKKKAWDLNFETSALKSFCSSVEMMAPILSNADPNIVTGFGPCIVTV